MGPVLTTIAQSEPEFIYYPVFTGPFGFITSQVRDVEGLETVGLMAADASFSSAAIQAAGPNALDMYLSSPDTRQFPAGYADFLTKHDEKYGEAPLSIFHAHAYDAANMLLDAVEAVAVEGADGSLEIDLGALRDEIYSTADYQGITGVLTCNETGDCGAPAIGVYQITQAIVDDPTGAWPPAPIWPEL
jgi:branched-chain amino acid transport system substrate-binding protein